MYRVVCILFLLLMCAAASLRAADDSLQTVKDLYASASYEEALAAVTRLAAEHPQPELEQYRVFCLIALGRNDEAGKAIAALVAADPLYVPDPAETPPRMQEAFRQTRQALLPELTKQLYLDARAALERKDRADAIARFEKLIGVIASAEGPAAAALADMRVLASGFLDLSRALPAAAAENTEAAPPAAAAPAAATVAASAEPPATPRPAASATRPVALKQDLPPWLPSDAVARRAQYDGAVRVRIDAKGHVESAEMVKSVHPAYDVVLLRAARGWMYEPARQNGVPTVSDLVVEVRLRPPQ